MKSKLDGDWLKADGLAVLKPNMVDQNKETGRLLELKVDGLLNLWSDSERTNQSGRSPDF